MLRDILIISRFEQKKLQIESKEATDKKMLRVLRFDYIKFSSALFLWKISGAAGNGMPSILASTRFFVLTPSTGKILLISFLRK